MKQALIYLVLVIVGASIGYFAAPRMSVDTPRPVGTGPDKGPPPYVDELYESDEASQIKTNRALYQIEVTVPIDTRQWDDLKANIAAGKYAVARDTIEKNISSKSPTLTAFLDTVFTKPADADFLWLEDYEHGGTDPVFKPKVRIAVLMPVNNPSDAKDIRQALKDQTTAGKKVRACKGYDHSKKNDVARGALWLIHGLNPQTGC